jgi:hypothetical protein
MWSLARASFTYALSKISDIEAFQVQIMRAIRAIKGGMILVGAFVVHFQLPCAAHGAQSA